MDRLPSSFRSKNHTTRRFREMYAALPQRIQDLAREACVLFDRDPGYRSLRHHQLKDQKGSSHEPGSFSVSITMQYRAIYVVENSVNVWYWIGTHAEYDKFTGG
jgi:hypothetical protein